MAELTACGARSGVLVTHGPHVVHLTLAHGGSVAELAWADEWGVSDESVVVACAASADGEAVAACTATKDVLLWEWDRWSISFTRLPTPFADTNHFVVFSELTTRVCKNAKPHDRAHIWIVEGMPSVRQIAAV